MTRMRKRSLGNLRFIGEFFKLKMLSEIVMHECITRLLKSSSDDESLECFTVLIKITGRDLDKSEDKVSGMACLHCAHVKCLNTLLMFARVESMLTSSVSLTSSRRGRFLLGSSSCCKMCRN